MSALGKYKLPKGWVWSTIPEIVGKNGVFIDGDWVESKDQDPDGDVRLIQLADVGDGAYRDKSNRFMTKTKADELSCTFLKEGDVLIARMPDPLGRACIFPGDEKPAVTVVDVAIARSGKGEFDHRWLACFVNAHPFRSAISGLQAGSTRKRISRGNLATIPLPVPPLPEQRRIVAEIEKQFSRLEEGVSALKRVQANLKRYRAAVLKAACEGNLVETEAELHRKHKTKNSKLRFESGEQLLKRILDERRKNWNGRGKYKEPAAPATTNLPQLPEGWTWASVEQLAAPELNSITDGPFGSNLKTEHYMESGPRVIRLQNIGDGVYIDEEAHISESHFESLQKHRIFANDVVIAGFGENPPRSCIIPEDLGPAIVKADCIRFKPHCSVMPKYMNAALNSDPVRKRTKGMVHGVGRPRLNLGEIRSIVLPLPPPTEQKRIVEEVERRLSVVEELESLVTTNLQRATRLRQSILQKAFEGEL
jgi:type I restriction enzyme S subunit